MTTGWGGDEFVIDSLPDGPRLGGHFHPPEAPLFWTMCGISVVVAVMVASVGPLILLWFDKVDVAGAVRLRGAYSHIDISVLLIVILYYFSSAWVAWHRSTQVRA